MLLDLIYELNDNYERNYVKQLKSCSYKVTNVEATPKLHRHTMILRCVIFFMFSLFLGLMMIFSFTLIISYAYMTSISSL